MASNGTPRLRSGRTAQSEGMTFGPRLPDGRRSVVLVSDDNFAATQFTQFMVFALDR